MYCLMSNVRYTINNAYYFFYYVFINMLKFTNYLIPVLWVQSVLNLEI